MCDCDSSQRPKVLGPDLLDAAQKALAAAASEVLVFDCPGCGGRARCCADQFGLIAQCDTCAVEVDVSKILTRYRLHLATCSDLRGSHILADEAIRGRALALEFLALAAGNQEEQT